MTLTELRALKQAIKDNKVPTNFSELGATVEDLKAVYAKNIRELGKDFNAYRRNRLDIFELMQEEFDDALPARIAATIGSFADIRNYPEGTEVKFKKKVGKTRAKSFVTKAAASGVYETFRLDTETFDVPVETFGGAGQIDFNRFVAGEEDIADYSDALAEGIEDAVYKEIYLALTNAYSSLPAKNKTASVTSEFSAAEMQKIVNTVKAYGKDAIIFATPQFISNMGADAIVSGSTAYAPVVPASDLEEIKTYGAPLYFRGTRIVPMQNTFTDETNSTWVLDNNYAFVLPTGGDRVVKVAMKGNTIVKDFENRDNSMEIQAYKRLGIAVLSYNNWGIYKCSGL